VFFDDLFDDGQADASAFVLLACMETLEKREDLAGVFLIEADPIVRDADAAVVALGGNCFAFLLGLVAESGTDAYVWRLAWASRT
jgi:hypothetical protein